MLKNRVAVNISLWIQGTFLFFIVFLFGPKLSRLNGTPSISYISLIPLAAISTIVFEF